MASVVRKNGSFSVRAYAGDAKTLLAFNLSKADAQRLAGFTISVEANGRPPDFLLNKLQFKTPGEHAQDPTEPANSSLNAPIHKFRWLHVPGSAHQGIDPVFGTYRYTVTPRYFDANRSMLPLDPTRAVAVSIEVRPFEKKRVALGFTRGFTQSQAFVRHFGLKALIRPKGDELVFDTSKESGVNAIGQHYTFAEEYAWLGFTARQRIFELLDEVIAKKSLRLDVLAYDLNEPDVIQALLKLAKQGRVRIILDNAALHHSSGSSKPAAAGSSKKTGPKAEDRVEALFKQSAKAPAEIRRGKFGRYAHDKVFIVSNTSGATKVLTGSTNLSVTGLYVNSNHVLVFDDSKVAGEYAKVFANAWDNNVSAVKFRASDLAKETFATPSTTTLRADITFSPHDESFATKLLDDLVARIDREGKKPGRIGSVLFAVMEIGAGTGPVYPALRGLHANQTIFSYGISDNPQGIFLYKPATKNGILVTGKPVNTQLPPPFSQVPNVGKGHQVHHKFVVCGFNGPDPVVYCGSSNLALKGEEVNGDNLLAIHDGDVATAFALEALALVEHFHFLDGMAKAPKGKKSAGSVPAAPFPDAAASVGWFLSTDDEWARPYFDPSDLHSVDRRLFA
jgi:phosphatidylserine/phosphatidylglycerophosphate/cardiolipin synthase-like enzyme